MMSQSLSREMREAVTRGKELRAGGAKWKLAAAAVGLTYAKLRRLADPEFDTRRKDRINELRRQRGWTYDRTENRHDLNWRPLTSQEVLAAVLSVPRDTRSLTGRAFGDPLPGRSALDQRNGDRCKAATSKTVSSEPGEKESVASPESWWSMEDRHSNPEAVR